MKKRDYLRVSPSVADPVKISFSQDESNQITPFIRVRNISVAGVMIQISESVTGRDGIFPSGSIIEQIRLVLPRQGSCVLSGIVRFMYGSLRGIEFLRNEQEQRKLARYVHQRQIELLGRDTSKWPEEKAFGPHSLDQGGLYKWLLEARAAEEEAATRRGDGGIPADGPALKKKVLIIDPTAEGRESYGAMFSSREFEPYADEGAKAEQMVSEIRPDIVLMDFCNPAARERGYQILKNIRSADLTGGAMVFLVTEGDGETVHKAMQLGVDDHIIKTGGRESVVEKVIRSLKK